MRLWPYLLLTIAGVGWGLGFPAGKFALGALSSPHMVILRLGISGLIAAPYVAFAPQARRLLLSDWRSWRTGAFWAPGYLVQFEGLAHVTVSLAALLVGLMPALVAVASTLWGERVSKATLAGVAAATVGGVIIGIRAGSAGGSAFGVGLILIGLLIFLGYLWSLRGMARTSDVLAGPAVVLFTGAVICFAIALPIYGPPPLHLSTATWLALLSQGVISTAVATAAWQIGAAQAPSASAGVFINLEPLVGALCGVALFGDRLAPPILIGGALILAGSVATVLSGHAAPEAA